MGEEVNEAILNFNPDYGYDRHDGDVLMGEMLIHINEIFMEDGIIYMTGELTGIYRDQPIIQLQRAGITQLDSYQTHLKKFEADLDGSFEIEFNYEAGNILEFSFIGWRTLLVDTKVILSEIEK